VFRRFGHLAVLVIDKYRYGENIFPRDVKFCPRTGTPPTAYQHLSLAGSRTGRSWCGGPAKEIRKKYIPYGDKILHCRENYSRRNGTCQWQVLQNARSGET
jgi:hypothetical protein